jgi:branched-chain amino acid transport system substrate-binding protein
MNVRLISCITLALCGAVANTTPAIAQPSPGVTPTEIRIGQTGALSGPAAQYGVLARTAQSYFRMVNDRGGIKGRKVTLIVADDEYNPAKSLAGVQRLVERDKVALMFGSFGTPTNSAQAPYLNQAGVPHLFLATGADKWGDFKTLPWTVGFQPSFRTEARIYTKHILETDPDPKIGVLYQNDDFGRDYLRGVNDILGRLQSFKLVKAVSYETSDTSVESQVAALKAARVNFLVLAAIPKYAAQVLRAAHAIDWKPVVYVALGAATVPTTTEPLKDRPGIRLISGAYMKAPADTHWERDAGMLRYRAFMAAYMPIDDANEPLSALAFNTGELLVKLLEQAGSDLSRDNIRRQAENLRQMTLPLLLPGITVSTSATDHYPVEQLQLMRWESGRWIRFGELMSTAEIPWKVGP